MSLFKKKINIILEEISIKHILVIGHTIFFVEITG